MATLTQRATALEAEVVGLKAKSASLEARVQTLESQNETLRQLADLVERVRRLEGGNPPSPPVPPPPNPPVPPSPPPPHVPPPPVPPSPPSPPVPPPPNPPPPPPPPPIPVPPSPPIPVDHQIHTGHDNIPNFAHHAGNGVTRAEVGSRVSVGVEDRHPVMGIQGTVSFDPARGGKLRSNVVLVYPDAGGLVTESSPSVVGLNSPEFRALPDTGTDLPMPQTDAEWKMAALGPERHLYDLDGLRMSETAAVSETIRHQTANPELRFPGVGGSPQIVHSAEPPESVNRLRSSLLYCPRCKDLYPKVNSSGVCPNCADPQLMGVLGPPQAPIWFRPLDVADGVPGHQRCWWLRGPKPDWKYTDPNEEFRRRRQTRTPYLPPDVFDRLSMGVVSVEGAGARYREYLHPDEAWDDLEESLESQVRSRPLSGSS